MAQSHTVSVEHTSSANIHSFSSILNKNGNITITFFEGTKQRQIKLIKGSKAFSLYVANYNQYAPIAGDDVATRSSIANLRLDYKFMKHANNPSVFYPQPKR